ncbi:hypothetical protein T310_8746, partial [Rasamsonia emersonii CBS 393.64]
ELSVPYFVPLGRHSFAVRPLLSPVWVEPDLLPPISCLSQALARSLSSDRLPLQMQKQVATGLRLGLQRHSFSLTNSAAVRPLSLFLRRGIPLGRRTEHFA